MLRWRLAISAILIPLLIGIFYLDAHGGESALWLLALAELLAFRGVWELADLFRDRTKRLQLPAMFLCAGGVVLGAWVPHLHGVPSSHLDLTPLALSFSFAVMLLCALESARFAVPGGNIETLGTEILIVSYMGLLLAMTAQLRWVAGVDAGYLALGSLLVCAKGGDIGAYFIGRLFGRNKLAPVLSPGKTWEGVLGALIGSGLSGWAWLYWGTSLFIRDAAPCAWYYAVLYGALVGIAGLIGDLCESLLKRDAGRKDSAALFPGFGGLLDLIDSVIYAGPLALFLWKVLPLATWQ